MTPASKPVSARKLAQAALDVGRAGQDRERYLKREKDGKSKLASAAFGWPGIEPKWTHGGKDGVGTAYAASSRIWFTLWNGIITEVYYPTVDHPQIRDLQYLITDGKTFFQEEKRHLKSQCERLSGHALGYCYTNADPDGRYTIVKEIITDPHLGCILQQTQLTGDEAFISKLHFYALCAPHLQVGGWGNNGYVIKVAGRKILMAQKKGIWLALGGTGPFFSGIVRLRGPK